MLNGRSLQKSRCGFLAIAGVIFNVRADIPSVKPRLVMLEELGLQTLERGLDR